MTHAHPLPEKLVKCPSCGGPSLYAQDNPYRPFCGERCKKIDLGAWASEAFRMRADEPSDASEIPPSEPNTESHNTRHH